MYGGLLGFQSPTLLLDFLPPTAHQPPACLPAGGLSYQHKPGLSSVDDVERSRRTTNDYPLLQIHTYTFHICLCTSQSPLMPSSLLRYNFPSISLAVHPNCEFVQLEIRAVRDCNSHHLHSCQPEPAPISTDFFNHQVGMPRSLPVSRHVGGTDNNCIP